MTFTVPLAKVLFLLFLFLSMKFSVVMHSYLTTAFSEERIWNYREVK